MDYRPANFLSPQRPPEGPENTGQKKRWLLFLTAWTLIFFAAFLVRQHNLRQWPSDASAYDGGTLTPKNIGFFQAVKNLIFHSSAVLAEESSDRVNILLLGVGGPGHDGPFL